MQLQFVMMHKYDDAPGNQLPALAAATTRVRGTDRALIPRLEVALSIIFDRLVMLLQQRKGPNKQVGGIACAAGTEVVERDCWILQYGSEPHEEGKSSHSLLAFAFMTTTSKDLVCTCHIWLYGQGSQLGPD